jgi:hypothetical protein
MTNRPHSVFVLDASGAGCENPASQTAQQRQHRTPFLYPAFFNSNIAPATGKIRPNYSLSGIESLGEHGTSLKLLVSNARLAAKTSSRPPTMDDVMALIAAYGKRHAFVEASKER